MEETKKRKRGRPYGSKNMLKNGSKALIFVTLTENQDKFAENLGELKGKEFCDCYIQLLKLITPKNLSIETTAGSGLSSLITELSDKLTKKK